MIETLPTRLLRTERTACQCNRCGTLHILPALKKFQQELIGVVCDCGQFVTPRIKLVNHV